MDHQVTDVTRTFLTSSVVASIRQVDYLANQVLQMAGAMDKVSQMPLVSIYIRYYQNILRNFIFSSFFLFPRF